jgi:uncharacterized MAPEG superfamily protein
MIPEFMSLVQISVFTGLLWVPYVLNRMAVGGIDATVGYPAEPPHLAPWAQRLRAAHANAVENLVVFAALILTAQVLYIHTPAMAVAGTLYLSSRILHAIAYTLGVRWLRTIGFLGGFTAQMTVAWQLVSNA